MVIVGLDIGINISAMVMINGAEPKPSSRNSARVLELFLSSTLSPYDLGADH
jgi:hypothetical protein